MHSHLKPVAPKPPHKDVYIDDSHNPGYLKIAAHVLPGSQASREPLVKVRIPGDGNCGFYAVALGLTNLVAQDKLVLSNKTYDDFLKHFKSSAVFKTLSSRATYYQNGIALDGKRVRLANCIPAMERIVKALRENKLATFSQFKRFLLNYHGYYDVLALAIFMGPALRNLTLELNSKLPTYPLTQYLGVPIIEPEARDGKDASFEQLKLLEGFFGIHLTGYNKQGEALGSNFDGAPAPTQTATSSAAKAQQKEEKSDLEEEIEDVDPLLGLSLKPTKKKASPSVSSSSSPASHEEIAEEEVKEAENTVLSNPMPTVSITHSDRPGHFDLLLPLNDYLSPPFYFGFNFAEIEFDRELEEEPLPDSLARAQEHLTREKVRFQQFRQELIKLKQAVATLSNDKEFQVGKKLIEALEANTNALFIPKTAPLPNRQEQHAAFVICSQALQKAHNKFQNKRPGLANIIVNLGLFVATLGIGYIVAASIHYCSTGRIGFFNKPSTILNNELPAFSKKLVELHRERTEPLIKSGTSTGEQTIEELPAQPAFKEWSKIRI
jgi:hypothetical protein